MPRRASISSVPAQVAKFGRCALHPPLPPRLGPDSPPAALHPSDHLPDPLSSPDPAHGKSACRDRSLHSPPTTYGDASSGALGGGARDDPHAISEPWTRYPPNEVRRPRAPDPFARLRPAGRALPSHTAARYQHHTAQAGPDERRLESLARPLLPEVVCCGAVRTCRCRVGRAQTTCLCGAAQVGHALAMSGLGLTASCAHDLSVFDQSTDARFLYAESGRP